MDRRVFLALSSAALLQGCGGVRAAGPSASGTDPQYRPVPNAAFDAWVSRFRTRARSAGITEATLNSGLSGIGFLPGVIERDRNQTEFRRSFEDYLSITAGEKKVELGRRKFAQHKSALDQIEARYGVPGQILTAIWGVETYFGTKMGLWPVVSATATLAFEGRRERLFTSQLLGAMRIIQSGDKTAKEMTGSWAGAMGHTQFLPTVFLDNAIDFNGDGRRDIWEDDPRDALASVANFLAKAGWRRGGTWAKENASGSLKPDPIGPRFAIGPNFKIIKRYNPSDSYALSVGYLADRIAGGGPLKTPFGPDKYGLTQVQRKALQSGLKRAGFDPGTIDGVFGKKTEAAIRAYQQSQGLEVTGNPSRALLERLS